MLARRKPGEIVLDCQGLSLRLSTGSSSGECLIDPGRVGTALRSRAYPGEKREKLPTPDSVTEPFVRLAEAGCDEQGSLVTIE